MEREEGELSDEEYEDVSDNSCISVLPLLISGKSSPLSVEREPFRELSLTSVSEDSLEESECAPRRHRTNKRARTNHHHHLHHHQDNYKTSETSANRTSRRITSHSNRYYDVSSCTSDSDGSVWRQLRDAVRAKSGSGSGKQRRRRRHRIVSPARDGDMTVHVCSSPDESSDLLNKRVWKQLQDAVRVTKTTTPTTISHGHARKRRRDRGGGGGGGGGEGGHISDEYVHVCSSPEVEKRKKHLSPDRTMWKQLRDAVRINSVQRPTHGTLRTRIQRMLEPDNQSDHQQQHHNNDADDDDGDVDDQELEALRDRALQSKHKTDPAENDTSITDSDLINLRLVALRSAVLKKHENRRKQRQQQQQHDQEQQQQQQEKEEKKDMEEEKEIKKGEEEEEIKKEKGEIKKEKEEEEEEVVDENKQEEKQQEQVDEEQKEIVNSESASSVGDDHSKQTQQTDYEDDEDILRAIVLTSIYKKMSDTIPEQAGGGTVNHKRPSVRVQTKPKLVAVAATAPPPPPPPLPPPPSTSTLSSSTPMNRFIIKVNSNSDSEDGGVSDGVAVKKNTHASHTGSARNIGGAGASTTSTSTTSAPPPKLDMFERKLSLFLKQARAKTEVYESDVSRHLPRHQQLEYKRLKRKLQLLSARPRPTPAPPRLHMKGKYEELAPLMARVTEARQARDQAQADVKRLINSLRGARLHLTETHRTYTTLMRQLVDSKEIIDKRLADKLIPKQHQQIQKQQQTTAAPTPPGNNKITDDSSLTKVKHEEEEAEVVVEVAIKEEKVEPIVNHEHEQENKEEKQENVASAGGGGGGGGGAAAAAASLHYSSPLDHIQRLDSSEAPAPDPLLVICPYELLGVCRDADCSYRHCKSTTTTNTSTTTTAHTTTAAAVPPSCFE